MWRDPNHPWNDRRIGWSTNKQPVDDQTVTAQRAARNWRVPRLGGVEPRSDRVGYQAVNRDAQPAFAEQKPTLSHADNGANRGLQNRAASVSAFAPRKHASFHPVETITTPSPRGSQGSSANASQRIAWNRWLALTVDGEETPAGFRYFTTKLTIRPGTTMTFTTVLPSSCP